jgi:hypothetical protein
MRLPREAKIKPRTNCAMLTVYGFCLYMSHGTDDLERAGVGKRGEGNILVGCEAVIYISLTARGTSKIPGYLGVTTQEQAGEP